MTTIAVIGGGAAGTLTAVQLARSWPTEVPLRVLMYDAGPRPARGLAYSTSEPQHLLNVPACRMSAVGDEPDHFLRWARNRDPDVEPEDFRPRSDYGDYLAELLADCASAISLVVRRATVEDVIPIGGRFRVVYDSGFDDVDAVVLAVGYAPPARPPAVVSPTAAGYVADPWRPEAMREIEDRTCPGDTVLTIGCGLTGVDVALSLAARGRRVVAVSRHGLLPARHRWPLPVPFTPRRPVPEGRMSLDDLERFVVEHLADARSQDIGWRAAVDGLRTLTPELWQRLAVDDRQAFLDGPARRWEVLRHRMAPPVAAEVDRLLAERTLTVIRGHVIAAKGEERSWRVTIRRDAVVETLSVAAVMNCTGPTCDITRYPGRLGQRLVDRGLVTPDPLRYGIVTDVRGAVVDVDGRADDRLFTLGALRRGSLYETTAMPELREQAQSVAAGLVSALATPVPPPAYPSDDVATAPDRPNVRAS
jgi:uncharacterized NAD(P)/FAD-binding protein YdhS